MSYPLMTSESEKDSHERMVYRKCQNRKRFYSMENDGGHIELSPVGISGEQLMNDWTCSKLAYIKVKIHFMEDI